MAMRGERTSGDDGNTVGRQVGEDEKFHTIARRVMELRQIPINDLHATTQAFPADHFVGPGDVHEPAAPNAKLAVGVAGEIGKRWP